MFEWLRARVLRSMRVPLAPTPPLGAPDSVRIFRAGDNHYKLRVLGWIIGQFGAALALGISLYLSWHFVGAVRTAQNVSAFAVESSAQKTPATINPAPPATPPVQSAPPAPAPPSAKQRKRDKNIDLVNQVARTAPWIVLLVEIAEVGAVLFFLAQLPVTFALVRLDFELHWYIVTDRSLRIRTGVLRLQEATMSFANIQQVTVTQGPVQRLLGLADVRVQSAGGGGSDEHKPGTDTSLHTGVFHGVANATEIRDLILHRLRQFRATGLGDPDDHPSPVGGVPSPGFDSSPALSAGTDTLTAARELLHEATSLRREISAGTPL